MELSIYIILALIAIFIVILWNVNNRPVYKRLRRAKAKWDSSQDFRDNAKAKWDSRQDFRDNVKTQTIQDLQRLRGDIGSTRRRATDIFDGDY